MFWINIIIVIVVIVVFNISNKRNNRSKSTNYIIYNTNIIKVVKIVSTNKKKFGNSDLISKINLNLNIREKRFKKNIVIVI